MRVLIFGLAVTALISMVAPAASAQQADDESMAHQIADNLKNSGQMKGYKVGVAFREGTAWLNGKVANAQQANQAEQVARNTPGVTRVINNLTINNSAVNSSPKPNRFLKTLTSIRSKAFAARRPAVQSAPANQYATQVAHNEPQGQVGTPFYAPSAPPVGKRPVQAPIQRQIQQTAAVQPQPLQSAARASNMPRPHARAAGYGQPIPSHVPGAHPARPATYDHPNMPNYAWPSYAAHPNYAGLTYPKQYSPTAWPFIGRFYPYPQVPLGWRKVTLEWDDGWWFLDFKEH